MPQTYLGPCKLENKFLYGVSCTKNCFSLISYKVSKKLTIRDSGFSNVPSTTLHKELSVVDIFLRIIHEFRNNILREYYQKTTFAVFQQIKSKVFILNDTLESFWKVKVHYFWFMFPSLFFFCNFPCL